MEIFLIGLALAFVFEGLLPFLSPRVWRRVMTQMIIQTDHKLRVFGFVSMIFGVILLYWVH